jgi:vancomycin resistance protein YoaR
MGRQVSGFFKKIQTHKYFSRTVKYYKTIFFLALLWLVPTSSVFANTENYALTKEMLVTKNHTVELPKNQLASLTTETFHKLITKPLALLNQDPLAYTQPFTSTKLDTASTYTWLVEVGKNTTTEPQDAVLTIDQNRATQFNPDQEGFSPDLPLSILSLAKNSSLDTSVLSLKGLAVQPKVTLKDLNSLGIAELIGRGRSTFRNSSKNRRTNIRVGISKMQGIILAPGDTFSFNDHLGSVEAKDGFVPEIVIKKSGLAPELGGGICQVSSTVFRGAVASGLPILERKNHSFAVSHYAPQGTDATTYTGVIDLKFTNNTPGSILIWPYYENDDTIVFDYYGTYDQRKVVLDDPVQYDRKSDGSLKSNWNRTVELFGHLTKDSFHSNYLSPALFKKTETFVPAVPETDPSKPLPDPNQQPQNPTTSPESPPVL